MATPTKKIPPKAAPKKTTAPVKKQSVEDKAKSLQDEMNKADTPQKMAAVKAKMAANPEIMRMMRNKQRVNTYLGTSV